MQVAPGSVPYEKGERHRIRLGTASLFVTTRFALLNGEIVDDREWEECSEISNIQREISDKFGGRHDLLINVKRVAIRGGTRLYTCRDVTRLKAAQDRAIQAERLADRGGFIEHVVLDEL